VQRNAIPPAGRRAFSCLNQDKPPYILLASPSRLGTRRTNSLVGLGPSRDQTPTPLNWIESGERRYYGFDFVEEAEKKVCIIQQNMKVVQSRQKSYTDKRRRPLEFEVGDYVYLKVTPMKKKWFGIKKKLVARSVGLYEIVEKKGLVAYKLQLPEAMSSIFPVFHVSQLKKCLRVLEERIEPQGIQIKLNLEYREQPV
jgi:hypothetical protein